MPTGADVFAEARTWVDVPLFHRGRTRAGGVDCLGLVIGVGLAAGVMAPPAEGDVPDYGRLPNPVRLVEGLAKFAHQVDRADRQVGDVLALSWGGRLHGQPMHLAILGEHLGRPTIIHANPKTRPARVVEMGFAAEWVERLCSAWRFPGVE